MTMASVQLKNIRSSVIIRSASIPLALIARLVIVALLMSRACKQSNIHYIYVGLSPFPSVNRRKLLRVKG